MTAAPFPAPVVAEAVSATRALLRMAEAGEAALLEQVAATALGIAEAFLATTLIVRPCEDLLIPDVGWQRLRAVPVAAIAGVTAVPVDAAPAVLAPAAYAIDIAADGTGWVRIAPGAGGRVAVAYSAGVASDWASLPPAIRQGVAMLAAHLFDGRGTDAMPPAAVAALWRPHRRMRLAEAAR